MIKTDQIITHADFFFFKVNQYYCYKDINIFFSAKLKIGDTLGCLIIKSLSQIWSWIFRVHGI